jgi:hypothetical protein
VLQLKAGTARTSSKTNKIKSKKGRWQTPQKTSRARAEDTKRKAWLKDMEHEITVLLKKLLLRKSRPKKTRMRLKRKGNHLPVTSAAESSAKRLPSHAEHANLIVTTVTSAGNFHRAKVMARSLKEHAPNSKLIVCLVEDQLPPLDIGSDMDEVILAKDLNIPDFHRNMFKYNVSEGTTSMKAAALLYAMDQNPAEQYFLYLDTDMRIYHPLDEIKDLLDEHPIYLTPHVLDPSSHNDVYLLTGIFNSGLLALRRDEQTNRFLHWWNEKLYTSCYFDDKYFADQGWLDFAPLYFDAQIWRDPGYNMAAWNIEESNRKITLSNNGYYYLGDKPLCIFHWSGNWGKFPDILEQALPDRNNLLYSLYESYMNELEEMGKSEFTQIPWSYNYYTDGGEIGKEARESYKQNQACFTDVDNPYEKSNAYYEESATVKLGN